MHNPEILDLFPTPLYTIDIPVGLSSVIPFLDSLDMNTGADEANYGRRSLDSYVLDKPECSALKKFILECVQDFGDNALLYDYSSYKMSQSWVSQKYPGQHHTIHTHPNSLISGVFYYGPSSNDTPAIKFHKMLGGFNQGVITPKQKIDRRSSKYAWIEFGVEFKPGLLVLFPSYLHHSVPVNESDSVRSSLAFNVVPTNGFGDELSLTELIF